MTTLESLVTNMTPYMGLTFDFWGVFSGANGTATAGSYLRGHRDHRGTAGAEAVGGTPANSNGSSRIGTGEKGDAAWRCGSVVAVLSLFCEGQRTTSEHQRQKRQVRLGNADLLAVRHSKRSPRGDASIGWSAGFWHNAIPTSTTGHFGPTMRPLSGAGPVVGCWLWLLVSGHKSGGH